MHRNQWLSILGRFSPFRALVAREKPMLSISLHTGMSMWRNTSGILCWIQFGERGGPGNADLCLWEIEASERAAITLSNPDGKVSM